MVRLAHNQALQVFSSSIEGSRLLSIFRHYGLARGPLRQLRCLEPKIEFRVLPCPVLKLQVCAVLLGTITVPGVCEQMKHPGSLHPELAYRVVIDPRLEL